MALPHIDELPDRPLPDRLGHAAPWWIALGVTGVALTLTSGAGPLLTSVAFVGIGSDADLTRRLREAAAAEPDDSARRVSTVIVAGFVRRLHAAMYGFLLVFAWASLLHLTGQSADPAAARWWLACDLAACAVVGLGYTRVARRHG